MSIAQNIIQIKEQLPNGVTLVAVSKTKPVALIQEAYNAGQRIFGENKAQELAEKHTELPSDIEWHFIGHLQSNKIKYIAPFVHLIHAVDSLRLLTEINKKAAQNNRIINCLLQVKIAQEESKFGLKKGAITTLINAKAIQDLKNIQIVGLMGMATNSTDLSLVKTEFSTLKSIFEELQFQHPQLQILSMGMSGDYQIAIESGSTMIRVGSSIFGARNYLK